MTLPSLSSLTFLADARWFRPGASTTAHHVDELFTLITVISAIFFVLIVALMALFMWKYRARPGHREEHSPHHNNALEVTWSVIPLLLVIWIFFKGFVGFMDMKTPPDNAVQIEVTAQKWSWSFKYPNGAVSPVLHVPAERPVKLIMSSKDVIHSLYIPAFRVKMDCVPGRYTELWFEATTPSEEVTDSVFDNDPTSENKYSDGSATYNDAEPSIGYDLFCTEYCGTGHSSMITKCVVHTTAGFEQQMKTLADPRAQGSPVEVGEKLYKQRGCAQCHSIDGSDNPANGGPSFKGHYGEKVAFTDGSSEEMGANYIRESILYPQKKVRAGYRPIMPTFMGQLNDDEIYALRQYIRSLNEEEPEDWMPKEGEEESGEGDQPSSEEEVPSAAAEEESSEEADAPESSEEAPADPESTTAEDSKSE